jgi:hypothetical protein
MSVFSLSESVFEQQFLESMASKAVVEGPVKRYQITTADDEDFVVEASNPSDLWQQINERDAQFDEGFFEHLDTSADFATMGDFVDWYTARFVDQGTDTLSVYEIADAERDLFDEPAAADAEEEDAEV